MSFINAGEGTAIIDLYRTGMPRTSGRLYVHKGKEILAWDSFILWHIAHDQGSFYEDKAGRYYFFTE